MEREKKKLFGELSTSSGKEGRKGARRQEGEVGRAKTMLGEEAEVVATDKAPGSSGEKGSGEQRGWPASLPSGVRQECPEGRWFGKPGKVTKCMLGWTSGSF